MGRYGVGGDEWNATLLPLLAFVAIGSDPLCCSIWSIVHALEETATLVCPSHGLAVRSCALLYSGLSCRPQSLLSD